MPDENYVRTIIAEGRKASDTEWLVKMAGFKEHTAPYQGLKMELARRMKGPERLLSRIAIWVSGASLLITAANVYFTHFA